MKFKRTFLVINLAILTQPHHAQTSYYDPRVDHVERIHAALKILEHENLIDNQGKYNQNGKFINNELKRFKTDSDLAKSDNHKKCSSCPNYSLTQNYIDHLKAHKHKLTENDQKTIDNLQPFISQQECEIELYWNKAQPSWGNTVFVLGIGIIIGYLFQYKHN